MKLIGNFFRDAAYWVHSRRLNETHGEAVEVLRHNHDLDEIAAVLMDIAGFFGVSDDTD